MNFAAFADRAADIEAESGDLATGALVAALFSDAGADLPALVRFLQGRVFPAHSDRTLDVGPSLCYEALARAAGPNVATDDVEDRLAEAGEIGAVAADLDLGGQRGLGAFAGDGRDDLTVAAVDDRLRELGAADGDGSEDRKRQLLFDLFNRAAPAEAKYLARLVLGEMRVGVGEGTVRDAVALSFVDDGSDRVDDDASDGDSDDADDARTATLAAFAGGDESPGETAGEETEEGIAADEGEADATGDDIDDADGADDANESAAADADAGEAEPPAPGADAVAVVERALQVTNDYGRVAELARDGGRAALEDVGLEVGRPVQAMLAQAGSVAGALEEWDRAAVEVKFDGARVQVHHDPDSETRVYSRNMEDVTGALPEVVETVRDAVSVPVILDGEVVAVDDDDGDPLPFQAVLRRFRRKHDVDRMREEVAVRFRAFDCLHHDGDDLLDEPLTTRHDRLDIAVPSAVADLLCSDDPEEIEAFADEALAAGHEGVMLKRPDSAYSPGKRGKRWLKRKPDVETLDLVVTGAEWGEGRRANLLGTFLLSVRREDGTADGDGGTADRFETVGKVATGITDETLADLTELLEPEIVAEDGTEVDLRPSVVFEVGYEEIQASPTYSAGYALRFPRFVAVREDKPPADADSLARVERLAERQ